MHLFFEDLYITATIQAQEDTIDILFQMMYIIKFKMIKYLGSGNY